MSDDERRLRAPDQPGLWVHHYGGRKDRVAVRHREDGTLVCTNLRFPERCYTAHEAPSVGGYFVLESASVAKPGDGLGFSLRSLRQL